MANNGKSSTKGGAKRPPAREIDPADEQAERVAAKDEGFHDLDDDGFIPLVIADRPFVVYEAGTVIQGVVMGYSERKETDEERAKREIDNESRDEEDQRGPRADFTLKLTKPCTVAEGKKDVDRKEREAKAGEVVFLSETYALSVLRRAAMAPGRFEVRVHFAKRVSIGGGHSAWRVNLGVKDLKERMMAQLAPQTMGSLLQGPAAKQLPAATSRPVEDEPPRFTDEIPY